MLASSDRAQEGLDVDDVSWDGDVKHCNHENYSMNDEAMKRLDALRQQNLLCDATIHTEDGTPFCVHRAILSACSSYFSFHHPLSTLVSVGTDTLQSHRQPKVNPDVHLQTETRTEDELRALFTTTLHENEQTEVFIEGVSSELMSTLLDFTYQKGIEISNKNVSQLLTTADYLGFDDVVQQCCEYLRKNIDDRNVLGVLKFARDHFCKSLELDAQRYVMRHFITIAQNSEELLHLPLVDISGMLASDNLNTKSEEVVWECALRWVNHDPDNRKDDIVVLLKDIRLGLLDTTYFLENVKNHPYVVGNEPCRPVVIETLKFLYDLEMIAQKGGVVDTPKIAQPRIPHEILFAIGGWSGGSPTDFIESYDTRADRWITVPEIDPTGPRAYHGTAVIGFNIFIIGGFDGTDYFNSCRCFNAVAKTWKEVAPMNSRRCYVSVAVECQVVYAMGGYDGHFRKNTAEKYNYLTNQWSMICPMNKQRSDASATSLNGKIYITGGFNGQECMNTAEVYDPDVNQWTMITPMRSRRSGVSCIAYHDCIYVIGGSSGGGFNGMSRMHSGERFSLVTNQWTPIPDMYHPRSNFAIEVIDDMIFAIGGFNGVTTIYHVECFDEKTNEWYEATDMNIFRSALAACVILGLPNTYDYIHKHRDCLMEEKRQKLLALEDQRNANNGQLNLNNNAANSNHRLNIVE